MSASYNKLLTDVTPGAPMHRAFKKYWHPVMRANRLEADGAPIRFTLLCEKYVAFRVTFCVKLGCMSYRPRIPHPALVELCCGLYGFLDADRQRTN